VRRLLSTRWLFWRSTYLPRWLGIVIAVDGLGWILLSVGIEHGLVQRLVQ